MPDQQSELLATEDVVAFFNGRFSAGALYVQRTRGEKPGAPPEGTTGGRSTARRTTEPGTNPRRSPQRITRRQRIVLMLKAAPTCSTTFLAARLPRAAAVIHKMRSEGWVIDTRKCSRPGHSHDNRQIEYVLEAAPDGR